MHTDSLSLFQQISLYIHLIPSDVIGLWGFSVGILCVLGVATFRLAALLNKDKNQPSPSLVFFATIWVVFSITVPSFFAEDSVRHAHYIISTIESSDYSISAVSSFIPTDQSQHGYVTAMIISPGKIRFLPGSIDGVSYAIGSPVPLALNGAEYSALYKYLPSFRSRMQNKDTVSLGKLNIISRACPTSSLLGFGLSGLQ